MASESDENTALTAAVRNRVRVALLCVCPDAIDLITSKAGVRRAARPEGADYQCGIARAAFHRILAKQKRVARTLHAAGSTEASNIAEEEEEESSIPSPPTLDDGGITVSFTTDLGSSVVCRYDSIDSLAHVLVAALSEVESDAAATGGEGARVVAEARVAAGGMVSLCSVTAMQRRRVQGLRHCMDCGDFFNGDRGLRDHQLVKHGKDYAASMEAVHAQQLVCFVAGAGGGGISGGSEAGEEQMLATKKRGMSRARDGLGHPGLEAAKRGDLKEVVRLVEAKVFDPLTACDRHGSGPLLWAAGGGFLEVCKYLAEQCGVPCSSLEGPSKKRQRNALHWAARNGHLPVVRWLVDERGVLVDGGTSDGTTPFMYAVWQGQTEVVEWLHQKESSGGGSGQKKQKKEEHKNDAGGGGGGVSGDGGGSGGGCDINAVNSFGCNAIQWCAQTGDVDMCAWLKRKGLDVGRTNRNGHSALHKAAVKGQTGVCEWLLRPEVPNREDGDGGNDGDGGGGGASAHREGGGGGLGLEQMLCDSDGNDPSDVARLEGFHGLAAWLRARKVELLEEQQTRQRKQTPHVTPQYLQQRGAETEGVD